jgi:D-alanyl-D-alanine carboxypeptidase
VAADPSTAREGRTLASRRHREQFAQVQGTGNKIRVGVGIALVAMTAPLCAPVWAQTSTFPATLEREALLVWMQRETDILPSQVVAVTPQAVTSIVSKFPAGVGLSPRIVIRAEALNPEIFARTGAMSWHVSLNADCQNRRIRLGETTGYSERNLLGVRKVLRESETAWRAPEPGTALEHAWRAACDPGFTGPFRSPSVKLAQIDAAPAQGAPVPPPPAESPKPAESLAPAVVAAAAPPLNAPPRVLPSSPGVGGPAVQLGALTTDQAARNLLISLSDRMQGHRTWVEKADVAGRTWHRALAGGFADFAEAARFCDNLKAGGVSCFVRRARNG